METIVYPSSLSSLLSGKAMACATWLEYQKGQKEKEKLVVNVRTCEDLEISCAVQ